MALSGWPERVPAVYLCCPCWLLLVYVALLVLLDLSVVFSPLISSKSEFSMRCGMTWVLIPTIVTGVVPGMMDYNGFFEQCFDKFVQHVCMFQLCACNSDVCLQNNFSFFSNNTMHI
jgi:hypothetical protein